MLMRHKGWSNEGAQLSESLGATTLNQELGGVEQKLERAMKEAGLRAPDPRGKGIPKSEHDALRMVKPRGKHPHEHLPRRMYKPL